MLAKVKTMAVVGLTAVPVTAEVEVSDGLPGMAIVGLPDPVVRESKERIKSAIRNSQWEWPRERVTVNLAPADVRKEGSAFDFPIALGLLVATRQLLQEALEDVVAVGELALDGQLRPVPGVLPMAMALAGKRFLVPTQNAREAAVVEGTSVYPMEHLNQAIAFLKGETPLTPLTWDPASLGIAQPDDAQGDLERAILPSGIAQEQIAQEGIAQRMELFSSDGLDFAEVKGQRLAKRAIEVAVAGGHNLLFIGPPGAGKTMLAKRIPTIMPEMSLKEALQTTVIYSVLGLLPHDRPLLTTRPFRFPHHSISDSGLIGGGSIPKPGEISLAHHGVLFLDELPEFNRSSLESLRQPLEEGVVTVARAQGSATFPARVMLIASMNPCPCGYAGDPTKRCLCPVSQIQRYRRKVSGPLLDRIDIHLEVPAVSSSELTSESGEPAESSESIRKRIVFARSIQGKRFDQNPGIFTNAQMRYRHIRRWCRLGAQGKELIRLAIDRLGISARGYDKILKVARTISDLAGSEEILPEHVAEAIQYRVLDRR